MSRNKKRIIKDSDKETVNGEKRVKNLNTRFEL